MPSTCRSGSAAGTAAHRGWPIIRTAIGGCAPSDAALIRSSFFKERFTDRERERPAGFLGIDPQPADP
jgi:hypothetical protein